MAQPQLAEPEPHQPRSSNQNELLLEEPRRSSAAQVEVERIGQADTYHILDRDIELFDWLDDQRDAKLCGYAIGLQGSGLPKSCQFYRMKYVKRRGRLLQVPAPVLYAEVHQHGGPTDLYHSILEEIGHPLARLGKLRDLRLRTWGTLRDYGVKILMIGNADYLKLEAFNELIDIFGQLQISVVLVGTDTLEETLNLSSSAYRRVHDAFLDSFDFHNLTKEDIKEVIEDWEEKFLSQNAQLNLSQITEVCQFLELKSKGRIEPLYDLLRKLAILKIDEPELQLSNIEELAKKLSGRKSPRDRITARKA
jgi:hypothetical protein